MSEDEPRPATGSVSEEAAKLITALQGWARDSGSEYADSAAGAAADLASSLGSVNEHLATGGEDCRYCPVCQVISAVRHTSPEVKEHLTNAATSLLQAAAGAMATQVPEQSRKRPGPPVEKIDLSDEGWEDEPWD